jgi:hypothetical protein
VHGGLSLLSRGIELSFRNTITTLALPFLLVLFFISPAPAQVNPSPEFDPHKIILKLKPTSRLLTRNTADARLARVKQLRPIKSDVVTRMRPLPGGVERIFVAEIADGENLEDALRDLAANPDVEYAERDYIMHADEAVPPAFRPMSSPRLDPGDPFFTQEWGLQNTGQYFGGYAGAPGMDINAVRAWDITTGDSNTILAILDSGIVFNSPEFEGRILRGYDFVNNDAIPMDDFGHGTKMAGIAAATGENGFLIAGVNWNCRILPVKILDAQGNGSYDNFAQGIIFATDQGAKVVSISAGGTGASVTLANAISYAQSHGVIIVASMGNNNVEFPTRYPAAYPGVIAVGAMNNRGRRAAPFSCSGTGGSNYGNHISFIAPGDQILSLDYNDPTLLSNQPGCGTSDAVPYVSGLISLMFAVNPLITYDQVYEALKAGARDQIGPAIEDTPGWDKYYGWGLIDAYQTLQSLPGVSQTYFAQVAVGGGFSTTFTMMNTGTQTVAGNLILAGNDGQPMTVVFSSPGQPDTTAASYGVQVSAGGTQIVTASAASSGPGSVGWARVESSGASLAGVATFQQINNGALTTIAGVLSADATSSAAIPVNDDRTLGSQSHMTGYAVANPGAEDIYVRILVLSPDGVVSQTLDPPLLNPLKPGTHVARFLWEDLGNPTLRFKGSMILTEQTGKQFSVVALVLNQGLYTAVPVIPGAEAGATSAMDTMLAQVAVGGGFTTAFTVVNTGSAPAAGSLSLIDDKGQPLNVVFSPPGDKGSIDSIYKINLSAGGTQFIVASAVNPAATAMGWARIDSSSGSLGGVATFQLLNGSTLATIAGVLATGTSGSAAIPVNDDRTLGGRSYVTGYAVANPGGEDINIRITVLRPDGSILKTIDPPLLNPLRPGWHVARFLWEDMNDPALQFRGSMILTEQSGKSFSVVALVLNQGLYTAIPVIPLKPPSE